MTSPFGFDVSELRLWLAIADVALLVLAAGIERRGRSWTVLS